MKNILKATLFVCLIFSSCQQRDLRGQLEACQQELEKANREASLEKPEPKLAHTVYLDFKDDITKDDLEQLMTGIQTLGKIQGVFDLKIGTFKDLGDQRALSQYEVVLQMAFHDETSYRLYQKDSIHLAFKKSVGHLLSGPPATYDFTME